VQAEREGHVGFAGASLATHLGHPDAREQRIHRREQVDYGLRDRRGSLGRRLGLDD